MARAMASAVLGVLALIAHLGALFVVLAYSDDGLWYLPAAAIGLAAVAVGWTARKRLPVRAAGRGLATVGMVLGAISLVYFGLVVADGIASRADALTLSGERLSLSEYRIRADAICSEELAQLDELATVDDDASLETYQQRLKPIAAGLESAADRLAEFRPPKSVEPDAFRMVNNFATAADQLREAIEADDKTEAVGKVHEARPIATFGFGDAQRLGLSTCTDASEDGTVSAIAPHSTNEDGSVPAIPPPSTNEDADRSTLPPRSDYAARAGAICTEEMARLSAVG